MEDIKYEEAIAQLEEITKKLENGQVSLDESMEYYSKAVELIKVCRKKLDDVKVKINVLTEKENGEVETSVLDSNQNSES